MIPIPSERYLNPVLDAASIEAPKENIPKVWDVRFIFGNDCILMISFSKKHPTGNFWWQFDPPLELSPEDYVSYRISMNKWGNILAAKAVDSFASLRNL